MNGEWQLHPYMFRERCRKRDPFKRYYYGIQGNLDTIDRIQEQTLNNVMNITSRFYLQ
jgi:hypothetical protein